MYGSAHAPPSRSARAAAGLAAASLLALGTCDSPDDEFLENVVRFTERSGPAHGTDGDGHADHLHPLDDPEWVAGATATHMRPDDPVVGHVAEGAAGAGERAWAIPWWILKNHHVANLTLDGTPLLIALCERCSSAAAWDPVVDGRRLHLRVSGFYNGTIALTDDETKTWWTPFLGEGMSGPLRGRRLVRRRLDQATWADWLELHPGTLVALGTPEMRLGHSEHDSPGKPYLGSTMRASILHEDRRLEPNELVLSVEVNGEWRAYPMKALDAAGSFVEDELGGVAIVVLHKPGTWLGAAFRRELDGKPLAFVKGEDGGALDAGTRSRWNAAGVAREGPLAGRRLKPVHYALEEWYVWATQHPGAPIHAEARD